MPLQDEWIAHGFLAHLAAEPSLTASVVAQNGDQNPYGVAVVPESFPMAEDIGPGDALVSDFNASSGLQGTGRSIVSVSPTGATATFFEAAQSFGPVGLTTALLVLRSGIVVVGSTPTTDGTFATIMDGGLFFLDGQGDVLLNLTDSALLRGPWDATADDSDPWCPVLYVSNVLDGTVTRINMHVERSGATLVPTIERLTRVASGFGTEPSSVALVLGPTGLVLSRDLQDLFVADTANNRVQRVRCVRTAARSRGAGDTVVSGPPLRGPLGLAPTPLRTLLTANGDAAGPDTTPQNLIVEFNPSRGRFVATRQLNSGAAGALFGIIVTRFAGSLSLLYVDNDLNTFSVIPTVGL
jgi:hypothetical protein